MAELAFAVPTSVASRPFLSSQSQSFTHSNVSQLHRQRVSATKCVRPARRVLTSSPSTITMQEEGADEVDDAPSDTYVPASEGTTTDENQQASKRSSIISRLLQLCAVTARGQLSTQGQRNSIEDYVTQLEEINPTPQPIDTDLIDGYWTLAYTSASSSNSSPVKTISKILLQPVLQLGQIRQRVAVTEGSISTEIDIIAFPATSGTVKSTGRITPVGGERLEVVVEKTTVTGGKLAGQLDLGGISFDIPVEQILSRVRNMSPETYFDTYYLDDQLRISRGKDGKLYVYTRLD